MFKNYLKIAIRNFKRHKTYSVINIVGLAIGMACTILILLWVQDELSYDRFHKNADRIYRVAEKGVLSGRHINVPITPVPMAKFLVNQFPEVISAVRILSPKFMQYRALINYKDKTFYEDRFFWVDDTFFELFTFPLVNGNPATALKEPNSIVVTKKLAKKYFGEEDPMGKKLKVNDQENLKITGIIEKIPHNLHFKFDFLISYSTRGEENDNWVTHIVYTYLLFQENHSAEQFEKKYHDFLKSRLGNEQITSYLYLQPLTSIHLHSNLLYELEVNGNIGYVYIYLAIAFFILMIASINFMNLSTARSSSRTKEVGFRKVVGAQRKQLIKQFLGEAIIISAIAMFIALSLVELIIPYFNSFSGKELNVDYHNLLILFGLIGITLIVGIVSGSYPALYLSVFQPIDIIKGISNTITKKAPLRRYLVVFQFMVSIILMTATMISISQLKFMKNKSLGFDKEQVIVATIPDGMHQKYNVLKNELKKNPRILNASASFSVPGRLIHRNFVRSAEDTKGEGVLVEMLYVDHDFIETLGIEITEGRNFSTEFPTDESNAFILNESAVKRFGWGSSSVGKELHQLYPGEKGLQIGHKGKVIGVMKDFHTTSLHQKIEPTVFIIRPNMFRFISIRMNTTNDIKKTLDFIKSKWQKLSPQTPFEYFFLDEDFERLYKSEEKLLKIISFFTSLAIFIACLGLFGLASFTTEQRTKEIGIRKVLGASLSGIVVLLTKEFTKWVLIANILAWPIAYYTMNKWLQNFAYRINIGIWSFLLAGALALVIALLTVSYQAIRTATANPVESLRYE